jgi:hypothetical protein
MTRCQWDFKPISDGKYKWEAYYSPMGLEVFKVYQWCYEKFGMPTNDRWDNTGGWVRFRDHGDMMLFLLRWS